MRLSWCGSRRTSSSPTEHRPLRHSSMQPRTIPIVFSVVNDPVAQGFIASMAHPGGNITGFSFLEYSMVGKSLEMLKQIAPGIVRAAVMFNPDTYPYYDIHLRSFETVAKFCRSSWPERRSAIRRNRRRCCKARTTAWQRAARHARSVHECPSRHGHPGSQSVPRSRHILVSAACSGRRLDVVRGRLVDIFARSASYVDRILKGTKPADCQCRRRSNSSWRSTSRPRRRSASKFRRRCLPSPTR